MSAALIASLLAATMHISTLAIGRQHCLQWSIGMQVVWNCTLHAEHGPPDAPALNLPKYCHDLGTR